MKASGILMDGVAQLHLEPENSFEKMLLREFAHIPHPVLVHDKVQFFETMGGFMRGNDKGEGLSLVRGLHRIESQ